jgi:hypothetical protein
MKTNLKRIALVLVSAVLFAGCGKDNKAVGDIAPPPVIDTNPLTPIIDGNSNGVRTFAEFRNEVSAGLFRNGSQPGFYYYRAITANNNNSNCTSYLSGFIQFCSYSSSSSCYGPSCETLPWRRVSTNGEITRSTSFEVDLFLGDTLISRKEILVSLMDTADKGYKCLSSLGQCLSEEGIINLCHNMYGYTPYGANCISNLENEVSKVFAFDSNGFSYIVNLNRPLGANPTHIGELGGNTIYVITN